MIRRLPVIPTILVLAAVATMIALGLWQLRRAGQKEALIASYQAAQGLPPTRWPTQAAAAEDLPLFRRASGRCLQPLATKAIAGRNRRGESGYSHLVDCRTGEADGPVLRVDIGWSRDPRAGGGWTGGPVGGVIAPDGERRVRLVSDRGLAGLEPSALPDVADVPNNHRGYAFQWFSFAVAALLIYGLAVRARLNERRP